jgi:hypothetical protein
MRAVELEAGLIGLVVGAVASGSVQAALAWFDRDRDARSAARLLYVKLDSADVALKALEDHDAWVPIALDFRQYTAAWEKRSDALSRVLESGDAIAVDRAFGLLDAVAMRKEEDQAAAEPGKEPGFTLPLDIVRAYRLQVQAAAHIVRVAAYTKREIRRGDFPEVIEGSDGS